MIQTHPALPVGGASCNFATHGFAASVHIQVGAEDGLAGKRMGGSLAYANPDWPMVQVAFCDLAASDREGQLDQFQAPASVVGVRQIVGRRQRRMPKAPMH